MGDAASQPDPRESLANPGSDPAQRPSQGSSRLAVQLPNQDQLSTQLPTGRALQRDAALQFACCGLLAGSLILLYLSVLLRVPPTRLRELLVGCAFAVPVFTLLAGWLHHRSGAPLVRCLDALANGTATSEAIRSAFRVALDMPRRSFLIGLLVTAGGAAVYLVAMELFTVDFRASTATLILLTSGSCGLLSVVVLYYMQKRRLEPIRSGLAALLPNPDERAELVRPFPTFWKLTACLLAATFVPLVFATFLAYTRASASGEALAAQLQERILSRALLHAPSAADDAFDEARADLRAFDLPFELHLLDLASGEVVRGPIESLSEPERLWIRDAATGTAAPPSRGGGADGLYSARLLRWRMLTAAGNAGEANAAANSPNSAANSAGESSDSDVRQLALVLSLERSALSGETPFAESFGATLAGAALLALALSWLMGRDLSSATKSLRESALAVAGGDLHTNYSFESEDEMGNVGRGLSHMADALRTTVGFVSESARRMLATSGHIETLSETSASIVAEQGLGVEEAHNSMALINVSVSNIAQSANSLNELVEQSSSSVLEMGTAGDELKNTAIVMSEKVDEVSASLSQISLSVKQVWSTTEGLSDAATETASSMEQMASAMRQVDENAERTSKLSRGVVEAAEQGQIKVRETILDMEQIRAATESAEQVIRGLGARATEIGSILDVIDDVADETNLLALNAAIIAAQAGEHGRAFAVVAGQIKQLADRVLSNTKEIGDRIRSVQEESANAVSAIENGTRIVAQSAERSSEAGLSLAEITRAARDAGDRISEILAAVREQAKAATHVVGMMESVNEGVAQIRFAAGEQTSGNEAITLSVETLREVAQMLLTTTTEQARGAQLIQTAIEGVGEAGAEIHEALQTQSSSCADAAEFLEAVASRNRESKTSTQRLEEATHELAGEAKRLAEDVSRFRL